MPACLQVFDVRMTPRMLSSVPFAPGPAILRFHPRFGDTLLLASAGGAFTLANAQGMSCERAGVGENGHAVHVHMCSERAGKRAAHVALC